MGPHAGGEIFRSDLPVAERPAGGAGDLGHGLCKRQRARSRHLVELAGMTLVRQRRDDDIGNVVDVDEWFGHGAGRQRELAGKHAIEQVAFREILVEPARANDGPGHAGLLQRRLRPLRARLAAARQQHDPLQPPLARQPADLGDRLGRALDRQIWLKGDIGHRHAVKRGRPGLGPGPVEGSRGRTRNRPGGDAARLQQRVNACAGLARAANDQDRELWHG